MSDPNQRFRQYAGLAVVLLAFVGGIVGWSWAVLSVESESPTSDTTQTHVEPFPKEASAQEASVGQ